MNNWTTKLGGALSALGTALMGFGLLPNKTSDNIDLTYGMSVAGFICLGLGQFFGHLFSASTQQVNALTATVADNTRALITGDKSQLFTPPVQSLGEAAAKVAAKQQADIPKP